MDMQQGNKINKDSEQKLLLKIVETWRPNEIPEYRGFRCANCQQYVSRAWYHWLNSGDYRLPVHMCDERCEPATSFSQKLGEQVRHIALTSFKINLTRFAISN